MTISYGFGKTKFGPAFLAMQGNQILRLSFVPASQEKQELKSLRLLHKCDEFEKQTNSWAQARLDLLMKKKTGTWVLEKYTGGTPFQRKVWMELTKIPFGSTSTYGEIAEQIGHPKSARAVGSAVGSNPIGYLIPCHRVLPKSRTIGQFAWGADLKEKMLRNENVLISRNLD